MSHQQLHSRQRMGRGEPARSVTSPAEKEAHFVHDFSEIPGGIGGWQRASASEKRDPPLDWGSGVSTEEVMVCPPSPGIMCALRCHPAVRALPPGRAFPAAQGSPLVMPLCSPGGTSVLQPTTTSHPRHPPVTLAGCQLSLMHGNPPCGQFRGSGKAVSCSWGVAAAPVHHGKLPASSESSVRGWLFFHHLITQPLLVLRKEELS